MNRLKVHEVRVVNTRDIDICVRDAFGKTHILFPHAEKVISTIVETTCRRSPVSDGPKQEK